MRNDPGVVYYKYDIPPMSSSTVLPYAFTCVLLVFIGQIWYNALMKFTFFKKNKEAEVIRQNSGGLFVDSVFKKVSKEIESLRQYDRGEKEIHAPNLRSLNRDLHLSSK